MATSAVSQNPIIPTLENYFGLGIEDEREFRAGNPTSEQPLGVTEDAVVWKNPHLAITPYIPAGKNNELIKTFQSVVHANPITLEESVFMNTTIILLNVDLKTFINFSEVNKCCYLATQVDVLWEGQLSQFLPQVTCISSNLCSFTPDQQFKIIYRRVIDESKPYIAKYQRDQEKCLALKEEVANLHNQLQEAGGKEAADRYLDLSHRAGKALMNGNTDEANALFTAIRQSKDEEAYTLHERWVYLDGSLGLISGKKGDGTAAPTPENCSQEKLLNAVNVLIPAAFDNQGKFEEVIRQAEVAKNITSALNTVTVEDVTDVAEPTEAKGA